MTVLDCSEFTKNRVQKYTTEIIGDLGKQSLRQLVGSDKTHSFMTNAYSVFCMLGTIPSTLLYIISFNFFHNPMIYFL